MKLFTYFRSSASYRVRIALNLKGISYEHAAVHLVKNGGEQLSEAYRQLNPEALVPALDDQGEVLTQSLAILEYLDEAYPAHPILPVSVLDRAHARALALSIACEIHPICNLRVLKYLTGTLGVTEEQKTAWYQHWVVSGLQVLETKLANDKRTGRFCMGDQPGIVDCCLIPQLFNAQRFNCDLSGMPTLTRIYENCMALPAFQAAAPGAQPDAE